MPAPPTDAPVSGGHTGLSLCQVLYKIQYRHPERPPTLRRAGAQNPPPRTPREGTKRTIMAVTPTAKQVFIQGITRSGRTFRPSDWAERLAGVMSPFRPGGARPTPGSHIAYSPWCVPTVMNGIKVVIVHTDLRDAEPMAWDFVMNFAKDNELQVTEGCLLPENDAGKSPAGG